MIPAEEQHSPKLPINPGLSWTDTLTELMHNLLVLAWFVLLIQWLATPWQRTLYLLLGCAAFLTFIIRKISRRIWQWLGLSLILLLIPFYLPLLPSIAEQGWPRLIWGTAWTILTIRSLYLRLRHGNQTAPTGSLLAQALALLPVIGLNMAADWLGVAGLNRFYLILCVCYLMLALIRWQRVTLRRQLTRFAGIASQPTGRIRRTNQYWLLLVLGAGAVLLLAAPGLQLHVLLIGLLQILLAVSRWIYTLFLVDQPAEPEPIVTPTPRPTAYPLWPPANQEPAAWLKVLQLVLNILATAVAVLAVIALVLTLLIWIYRRFYARLPADTDQHESLQPAVSDLARERLQRTRTRWQQQFGQSPAQRIRRLYYHLIESQIRHGLVYLPHLTPRQLLASLATDQFPQLLEIEALYEKARYGSDQACQDHDVNRMRQLVQQIRRLNLVRQQPVPETADSTSQNP